MRLHHHSWRKPACSKAEAVSGAIFAASLTSKLGGDAMLGGPAAPGVNAQLGAAAKRPQVDDWRRAGQTMNAPQRRNGHMLMVVPRWW